jgi:Zn finger protein HypA/HybF involved in hydrogenase expression
MNDVTPHVHGEAVCDDCGHRWVAVWPLGSDALECPNCHSTNTDREQEKNHG